MKENKIYTDEILKIKCPICSGDLNSRVVIQGKQIHCYKCLNPYLYDVLSILRKPLSKKTVADRWTLVKYMTFGDSRTPLLDETLMLDEVLLGDYTRDMVVDKFEGDLKEYKPVNEYWDEQMKTQESILKALSWDEEFVRIYRLWITGNDFKAIEKATKMEISRIIMKVSQNKAEGIIQRFK